MSSVLLIGPGDSRGRNVIYVSSKIPQKDNVVRSFLEKDYFTIDGFQNVEGLHEIEIMSLAGMIDRVAEVRARSEYKGNSGLFQLQQSLARRYKADLLQTPSGTTFVGEGEAQTRF